VEGGEGNERFIIVDPVEFGHPVVGLVGSDGSRGTGRCDLFGEIVGSTEVASTDDLMHVSRESVGVDDGIETLIGEQS